MGEHIRTFVAQLCAVFLFLLTTSFAMAPTTSAEENTPGESACIAIVNEGLSPKALENAIVGYGKLTEEEKLDKQRLIVIDFTKSSNLERFYVLDMQDTSLTYSSLVAHGKNTGNEFATSFSNVSGSYMSSLGFYKTAETYDGKHGLSLRLDGLEFGINHKARERAIVIHQADYVSFDFAAEHGRIGRSLGCPALPTEDYAEVIDYIKEGCLLYIFGGDDQYALQSNILSKS